FSSYQESVKKLSEETKKTGQILDDGAVCEICHKTKFADGVGHSCHFCFKKSCARCGGRMPGKGNPPSKDNKPATIWACNLCKKKQDLLAKTGAWYHGGMARPVALDVGDVSSAPESGSTGRSGMGGITGSISGQGLSPSTEKRAKMMDRGSNDGSQGSEKENFDRQKGSFSRAGSLQGKELKRQFSMSDAMNRGHDGGQGASSGLVGGSGGGASQTSSGISQAGSDHMSAGQERGRGKERGQSKHRFYSESRLSETDRRYGDSSSSISQQEQQQQVQQQHQQQQQQQSEHARDRHKGDAGSRHESAVGTSSSSGKQDHGNYRTEADMREADRKDRHREDRRHDERETLDRRRDAKERRKEPRAGEGSGGERDRYRQSPVNGGRREESGGYRGSRERLSDIQQQQQAALEGGAPDTSSDIPRSDRRSGSTRHHRGSGSSGGGGVSSSGGGVERTPKEQRRSPSRDRDRDRDREPRSSKDNSGGVAGDGVHADMQFSRHRILIDHASDTQAEDPRDSVSVDPNDKKQHLDPSSAGGRTRNNRKKMESMLRNDSLSSDPSDCVRPPPPKPHKHRRGKKQRQQSLSSSDDEIQSTPDCSSCEELDMESESVSEKGELESVGGGSVGSGGGRRRAVKSGKSSLTKARLETLAKPTLYDTGRGTSLETESGSSEPQVKDSGNDTGMSSSSNQTINTVDDAAVAAAKNAMTSAGGHPVTWQSSADGSKWIGHMILKKTVLESGGEKRDSSAILG
ncbi:hypothetical protein EGW08_005082, partial [Elysia chlorotica]